MPELFILTLLVLPCIVTLICLFGIGGYPINLIELFGLFGIQAFVACAFLAIINSFESAGILFHTFKGFVGLIVLAQGTGVLLEISFHSFCHIQEIVNETPNS